MFPSVLPGGRGVLFTIDTAGKRQLAGGDPRPEDRAAKDARLGAASDAEYVESGHLIYAAAGALRAVGFDPVRLEVLSDPVTVVETVMTTPAAPPTMPCRGPARSSIRRAGRGAQQSLVWVDRKGREEPIKAPARAYAFPRLSPDGTRVVVRRSGIRNTEIWIWDFARERLRRLTFDPANE